MIPLGDAVRRPLRFPVITTLLIALNAVVFILELIGGDDFIGQWVMVPAEISSGHNLVTILSAMFMHAGWEHIIGNMLFLWVFGPEIEDVMGPGRYLAFYLLGGLAATVAQVMIEPDSTVPNLGASGAIAAVLGGFLVTFPRDRIRTILLLGWFVTVRFIPAFFLIGFWFLTQLFSEVGAVVQVQQGGVAYMAHIGGFIFGAATVRLFEVPELLAEQEAQTHEPPPPDDR
ncbi:MAG TPA: rhomboid family intramembrane serine protease [Candidatus Xenobia bacterium]|jgi:membrane associated rhomboid family serine protease